MTIYPTAYKTKKYYFTDTSFDNLMKKRIYHVLLISSKYDAFLLEVTEQSRLISHFLKNIFNKIN